MKLAAVLALALRQDTGLLCMTGLRQVATYLRQGINRMVSVKSIHPQTCQLNFITRNRNIKLTSLWVNWRWSNHSIDTFCEIRSERFRPRVSECTDEAEVNRLWAPHDQDTGLLCMTGLRQI